MLYLTIIVLQRSKDSFLPPTKKLPLSNIFYTQTLTVMYIAGLHLSLTSFALLPPTTGYRIITCSKPILFTNSTWSATGLPLLPLAPVTTNFKREKEIHVRKKKKKPTLIHGYSHAACVWQSKLQSTSSLLQKKLKAFTWRFKQFSQRKKLASSSTMIVGRIVLNTCALRTGFILERGLAGFPQFGKKCRIKFTLPCQMGRQTKKKKQTNKKTG